MRKIKPNADGPKIHCLYDELVDPKTLKYHPKNRNKHPKDQIERLAKIIDYQGWRYPIKVSKLSGCVTSGHGRIAAAFLKKWTQVPVVFQEYENEDQEYADVQSDNAIASWAELDLAAINLDIPDIGPEFDIDWLGIKNFTLDVTDKFADKDADEVPEVKEPFVKLGELWQLGRHRLLCGDSTDKAQVDRLMNGEKADMVYTDPPYGVAFQNHHDGIYKNGDNSKRSKKEVIQGDFDVESILGFLPLLKSYVAGPAYVFCGAGNELPVLKAIEQANFRIISTLIWKKQNRTVALNANYKPCFEMFYYFVIGSDRRWSGNNDQWTVWEVNGDQKNEYHPTQKPVSLIEMALKNHTTALILDLFLGSGSTLIACEKTNRKCFGMEIDPHYATVIVERWEKFTGQKAVKQ